MRVKEILKEKGISVSELADMLGVSRQALHRQMQGRLLVGTAQKMADALGVELWELFKAPGPPPSPHRCELDCPHCGKPIRVELKKATD